jgi:hypothetical protein
MEMAVSEGRLLELSGDPLLLIREDAECRPALPPAPADPKLR